MSFKKIFKFVFKCFLLAILVIFLVVLYPVFIEPNLLVVKHKKLYLPNWSQEHNGLKVAVLSDFHVNKYGITVSKLNKIVKKTNKENPDFIFLLGDLDSYLIERYKLDKNEISNNLSKFKSKYGVISVLGNHDYGPRVVKPILENANIKVLENKKITVKVKSKPIIIYGAKDEWHFSPKVEKMISKKYRGDSIILLSHNPDLFPRVPEFVSLTLSGHTHGGQICLPYFGGLFTPSIWEQRYNKGYIAENNKHLYVTSGLGFVVPLRFGNPPEIVILELYSQDSYPENTITDTDILTGIPHSLNAIGNVFARKFLALFNFKF